MPVFLEQFLLPVFVALVVALLAGTNPMGFDWTQRISGGLAIIFAAFFISYTLHKQKTPEPSPAPASNAATVSERKSPEPPEQNAKPTSKSSSKESGREADPPALTQQLEKKTRKVENKKPETPTGTTDRSVKIGPNSNVTNSPIVTGDGNVVLSGPEARIQSLDFRIAIDVPTVATPADKPGDAGVSVGFQNIIGLFDFQKNRYRFASSNFQFTDVQTTQTTHRYGFSYNPEDGNDLVGRPITVLAQMDKLGFNFAEFLKTVAANKIVTDRPTQLSLSISLNGIAVMNAPISVGTQALLNGQVTTDVGGMFTQIESAYKEALKKRSHP